eukprot:8120133-Pyramimonas_sp.AAC.1
MLARVLSRALVLSGMSQRLAITTQLVTHHPTNKMGSLNSFGGRARALSALRSPFTSMPPRFTRSNRGGHRNLPTSATRCAVGRDDNNVYPPNRDGSRSSHIPESNSKSGRHQFLPRRVALFSTASASAAAAFDAANKKPESSLTVSTGVRCFIVSSYLPRVRRA